MTTPAIAAPMSPTIIGVTTRERARDLLRRSFPRRRGRLTLVRSADELAVALKDDVTDAVVVDLAQPTDELWQAAALAREFPSVPFFALAPMRPADVAAIARACTEFEFADCLVEVAEDGAQREVILPATFSWRLAAALAPAGDELGLSTPLQQEIWRLIIASGGRTIRTEALAGAVGLTREHLSRRFAAAGSPNLKRVIDLARLLSAAELSKNAGYDLSDVARILGFASASHLSSSCQRLLGVKSASLARLRPADLISRFARQGRSRSRQSAGRA